MEFGPFGGGRTFGVGTNFDDAVPFLSSEFKWTFAGKIGAIIAALWGAQAAAGALAGAGVVWASSHVTHYGPSGILGSYSRYVPNLTLGSTLFYAHAGDVVHVSCDAEIRVGQIDVYLWRMPGLNNSKTTNVKKSGAQEFDLPIPQDGFYQLMHDGTDLWPSPQWKKDAAVRTDLSYKLSWKLQRPAPG